MATNGLNSCSSTNGSGGFRIKRPIITTNGSVSDIDPTVKNLLDELNQLLSRRIFAVDVLKPARSVRAKVAVVPADKTRVKPDIKQLLGRPLNPKQMPDIWEQNTLGAELNDADDDPVKSTLSDYIDMTAELSTLKYSFQSTLSRNWSTLDYNIKMVLDGYPAISDYLVAYAFYVMEIEDACALRNFIINNPSGARKVIDYAVISGARAIIDKEQLNVPHANDDNGELAKQLTANKISLSLLSFSTTAKAIIKDHVFNAKQIELIRGAHLGTLPPDLTAKLIRSIRQSPSTITARNAKSFLPAFISQLTGPPQLDTEEGTGAAVSDSDFDITPIEDDNSTIQISRSAVKCASQLYYCMVMADELSVLGTVDYFTHKYLIRNGMDIVDGNLRDDLQNYVFSSRFTDLKTNRLTDRTRAPERQMFYRQVFDYGTTQVPDELLVNEDFVRLWKTLMLESARYIDRAQASPNPDSYVSRQNVMQAIEDLQYNLSTSCTGMANVVTPLIYAELDFVIRRIFQHREVIAQVVPSGGTWWKVIEVLYMAMNNTRMKATVLYNKAKLGNEIIRTIADYNPASFEDDQTFSGFISDVDAYITTQSILQDALTDDLKAGQENGAASRMTPPAMPAAPSRNVPVGAGAGTGADEWDF